MNLDAVSFDSRIVLFGFVELELAIFYSLPVPGILNKACRLRCFQVAEFIFLLSRASTRV